MIAVEKNYVTMDNFLKTEIIVSILAEKFVFYKNVGDKGRGIGRMVLT